MNLLNRYSKTFLTLGLALSVNIFYAQQGAVTVNQPSEIDALLALKKEMNTSNEDSGRYKIQIFSGDRSGADKTITDFEDKFEKIPTKLVYETPNYKVWVGNFRNRLDADRGLEIIREEFPDAFRFKPKKKEKKETK
ncbi:SPOR domain-containing protein [Bizionia sp. KMM 8389]